MKKTLQKIAMAVAAIIMFTGVMLLSVEKNDQGQWEFATVTSLAQGGENGGGEDGEGEDGDDGCPKVSFKSESTITWNEWIPYDDEGELCLIVTMEGMETYCGGAPGTIACCSGIHSQKQLGEDWGECP